MEEIASGQVTAEQEREDLRKAGFIDNGNGVYVAKDSSGKYISEATIIGTNAREKTPFYYDQALLQTLTSVSLHANSVLNSQTGEWNKPKELTDNEGYLEEYLIKAPLLEDYVIMAQNNWSEFGDDEISKLWNSYKPIQPYLETASKHLGTMLGITKEKRQTDSKIAGSFVAGFLEDLISGAKELVDKSSKYMGRSLIAQGTRFSYYSGTSTTFGNLSMKFTVFSGWRTNYYTSKTEWKSVDDQLKNLYPYVMGQYKTTVANLQEGDLGMTKEQAGKANKTINEFLAWQLPPAGYKPDLKTWDNCTFGTLKLKFGAFYSIPALVCSNAQFNFSKQMVKYVEEGTGKNKISPLYCDVVLNFQPATKFSDDAIIRFINGQTMSDEVGSIKNGLKTNLDKVKEKNTNFLNGRYTT